MADDRNAEIREWRRRGATLQQIAARFHLTPQRVGQIAADRTSRRGVVCPECSGDSRVLQTRDCHGYTYRRHECRACAFRWSSEQRNRASANNQRNS